MFAILEIVRHLWLNFCLFNGFPVQSDRSGDRAKRSHVCPQVVPIGHISDALQLNPLAKRKELVIWSHFHYISVSVVQFKAYETGVKHWEHLRQGQDICQNELKLGQL